MTFSGMLKTQLKVLTRTAHGLAIVMSAKASRSKKKTNNNDSPQNPVISSRGKSAQILAATQEPRQLRTRGPKIFEVATSGDPQSNIYPSIGAASGAHDEDQVPLAQTPHATSNQLSRASNARLASKNVKFSQPSAPDTAEELFNPSAHGGGETSVLVLPRVSFQSESQSSRNLPLRNPSAASRTAACRFLDMNSDSEEGDTNNSEGYVSEEINHHDGYESYKQSLQEPRAAIVEDLSTLNISSPAPILPAKGKGVRRAKKVIEDELVPLRKCKYMPLRGGQ
jgi:hypothetical protein